MSSGLGKFGGQPGPGARIGPYVIQREIARGGHGAVYVARHQELDREVALKVLLPLGGRRALQRFMGEARASARLRHSNIVTTHEVGEDGGRTYLAMELVEGSSLRDRLARGGPLPPSEAAAMTATLARALHVAHKAGILHRDLKPANVLLAADGRPMIADFGLAKDLHEGEALTVSGEVIGTPEFMPPEQATGKGKAVDRRADVYSLGATLYAMLTGRGPFVGDTLLNMVVQIASRAPDPPSAVNASVPVGLDAICLRCLEKDPARRYPDAQALAEALEGWSPDAASRSGGRWWLVMAVGALVGLAAILVPVALSQGPGGEPQAIAPAQPEPAPADAPPGVPRQSSDAERPALATRLHAGPRIVGGYAQPVGKLLAWGSGKALTVDRTVLKSKRFRAKKASFDLWDLASGKRRRVLEIERSYGPVVRQRPDGGWLVAATARRGSPKRPYNLVLLEPDLQTHHRRWVPGEDGGDVVLALASSPKGKLLALGFRSGRLLVLRWPEVKTARREVVAHRDYRHSYAQIVDVGFVDEETLMVVTSGQKEQELRPMELRRWDLRHRAEAEALSLLAPPSRLAVVPNSRKVVVGLSWYYAIVAHDVDTLEPLSVTFAGSDAEPHVSTNALTEKVSAAHTFIPRHIAFSPDGARMFSVSATTATPGTGARQACELRAWDVATGRELAVVKRDENIVDMAVTPDGRELLTLVWDERRSRSTLEAWDVGED